ASEPRVSSGWAKRGSASSIVSSQTVSVQESRSKPMKTGHRLEGVQSNGRLRRTMRSGAWDREAVAARYLRHAAFGGLTDAELEHAELTYVFWDWDGLASLAYEQFLMRGRGVLVGPRAVTDEETITVAFDYVPNASGSIAETLDEEVAASL